MIRPVRAALLAALLITSTSASPVFASSLTVTSIGAIKPFDEKNCPGQDAGNSLSEACMVTGGPYDGFIGDIGGGFVAGSLDTQLAPDAFDFFAFHWLNTGQFTASYAGTVPVVMGLFHYVSQQPVAGDTNSSPMIVSIPNLAAGNYILGLSAEADPPFSVTLFGPTTSSSDLITGIDQVPEPTSWLLLATGLTLALRRRASRSA